MSLPNLTSFTMRTTPPKAGEDWFRIVKAKKKGEATKVYIYDEIGFWGTTAKDFAAALDDIETDEIHLHINSPGGSVFDGVAIYNTLKQHDAKVTAFIDGLAASAASFIVQAAEDRIISRNAQMMIHDAKAFAGGNAAQMRKAAELLDTVSDNIADIYSQRGELTADEFRKKMLAETWYRGSEAKDDGLVDTVTDEEDEEAEEDAKNKWDLTALFNYGGRDEAPPPTLATLNRVSINNRVEEAQNMGDQPATPTPPAVQQPPAPQATSDPAPAPEPTQPTPSPDPAPAPAPGGPTSLLVNGTAVTDFAAVQQHITGLEAFKKETIEGGRKAFVASLASGNKIAATQIEDMEKFSLSLSNEQFDQWKASMEAAPASTLFGQHGKTGGDASAPQNGPSDDDLDDQIAIHQGIVDNHKAGGMSQEDLEKKPSWQKLQNLLEQKNKQTSNS